MADKDVDEITIFVMNKSAIFIKMKNIAQIYGDYSANNLDYFHRYTYLQSWLFLGTLWPAYSSFKAVRTRDNQEYVRSRIIVIIININKHQYQPSGVRVGICQRNSSNPPQGRWMAHWVVMAFFNAADSILSPLFIWYNSYFVPFVYLIILSLYS